MPAGSEGQPDLRLPHSFRPLGVRIAIIILGSVLLLAALGIWVAFPSEVRAQFTGFQIGTIVFFGLLFYGAGYALARSRVVARADGVTIVNGYRTRRFAWNQVLAVTLRSGSPWAMVDLSDGTTVPAMGIQGSDGDRAKRQVRQLRRLVEGHTR